MKNNSRNRGFSLIELIVIISMITVLAGVLVPQFVKYATEKRQTACRANREALLNIYEKAVYDGQLSLTSADMQMIVDASGDKMTTEYSNQAADYLRCPQDNNVGHYSVYVDETNGKAYLICDCHSDDVCSIDFVGWKNKENDDMGGEPAYPVPGGGPEGPEPAGPADTPETPDPVNTAETVNTGIWPRPMDAQGRIDSRWAAAGGAKAGNSVNLTVPLHFIDTTGAEIVIVRGNTSATNYQVTYENSLSPLGRGMSAMDYVVAASGKKYDSKNLPDYQIKEGEPIKDKWIEAVRKGTRKSIEEYNAMSDVEKENYEAKKGWVQSGRNWVYDVDHYEAKANKDGYWTYNGTSPSTTLYRVNYGDMIDINGVTYIYTVNKANEYVEIPTAEQTAQGTNYGGWYVVPALKTAN